MYKISYYFIPFLFLQINISFGSLARVTNGKIRDTLQLFAELNNIDEDFYESKINNIWTSIDTEKLNVSTENFKKDASDPLLQAQEQNKYKHKALKNLGYSFGYGTVSYLTYEICKYLISQERDDLKTKIFAISLATCAGTTVASFIHARKAYAQSIFYINYNRTIQRHLRQIHSYKTVALSKAQTT